MTIIASVVFLIVGTVLAATATARWSMLEPYGLIPHFIGREINFERHGQFLVYLLRAASFFFLVVAAALAQTLFGVWSLLLLVVGGFPSGMMVRQHNRRVRAMWRPREVE
ncbi:hypothetical protein N24_1259 [Corynebacterium suranareeae]|uniref:Uncharacterized protein n=1 Tax=Corynebacterium suranareeae TaxID=2506452 RepID=A0A160PRP6_9CORY|nr:hypothetical protein [Corynebacterium suranareeae]BAU95521.1 hypothetical protein N24_1259 [Corynebacterium suranareeae]